MAPPIRWREIFTVWTSYFLPFIPASPRIGIFAEAVCIFVQAFGRNRFSDNECGWMLWNLRVEAKMDDMDALVLLKCQDFDPGSANRALAKAAMRLSEHYGIPIIAQWEVAFAIFETDIRWYMAHRHVIDVIWPPEEGYFATYHVKMSSCERMRTRGLIGRPLELAHPAMLARAIPICWKVGVNPVTDAVPFLRFWKHELWVWDKRSVQPWTRAFFPNWMLREVPGRLLLIFFSVFSWARALVPHAIAENLPDDWVAFRP